MQPVSQHCRVCQAPIRSLHLHPGSDGPAVTGRIRQYCSDKCRKAASRQRRPKLMKVTITLTQEEREQLSSTAHANGYSVQGLAAYAVRALLAGRIPY